MKFMSDKVLIDHQNKIIDIYDGKVTFVGENFSPHYRKMKYYIQGGVYFTGVTEWVKKERPELIEFRINPIKFIVSDSTRNCRPLIFTTNSQDLIDSLNGFTYNGYYYKGILEIAKEIRWCKERNIWEISKKNFENNGIVSISDDIFENE